MQHPDEGTIHSWLDGALSADEAARVEAHVKDCPECAAAVAEARGFIAASSRILTALDNAPRGVIPIAAPKKRVDPIVWRVAATLLVVAGGTFVVLRNGGREAPSVISDNVGVAGAVTAVAPQTPDSTSAVAAATSNKAERTTLTAKAPAPIKSPAISPRAVIGGSAQNVFSGKEVSKRGVVDMSTANGKLPAAATPPVAYSAPAAAPAPQGNIPGALYGTATPRTGTTAEPGPPILRALPPAPAGSIAALDATSEPQALKIVGAARQIGAKTTLYEVAPGDTVTLTEIVGAQLESVVVTGLSAARTADQSTQKSAPAQATKGAVAPAVTASDSQGAAGTASPTSARAPQARTGNVLTSRTGNVQVANGVTTISWTDSVTRNVMRLSGRMSPARLQEVKNQIERERAAEAAKKKP
jgi:anti-sigma factor RsiW